MKTLIAICGLVSLTQVTAALNGYPPLITVPKGNKWPYALVYVRKANHQEFKCEAIAEPPAKYYWTVNGTTIVSDERTVAFNELTGTLTTGSLFGELHTGDYQCFAINAHGTAMTPILKITATVANAFRGSSLTVTDEYVDVSKYIKLECQDVPHSVPQWQFSWQKGFLNLDKTLDATEVELSDRVAIDKKGHLHFLWTEKSDDGLIYRCATKNNILLFEVANLKTIKLTVNDGIQGDREPRLEYQEDVEVLAGDDAELMCIFSYYSSTGEKLKINWIRNGEKVGEGYKLKLKNVLLPDDTQNMEGEYMCEAELGNVKKSGQVNLKIIAPPRFTKEPETKTVLAGNDAEFYCETKSHNSYSEPVVWFMNAVPIIGCHDHRFECKTPDTSYSQCLEERYVCNNDPDCDDESDEQNCPGTCREGHVWCMDRCQSKDAECAAINCEFPGFLCKDKKMCLQKDSVCDGLKSCDDGSDERGCSGGPMITRKRWQISSDRTKLVLPSVTLDDTMCVQCLVRNEYGSTIGDACLTVIADNTTKKPIHITSTRSGAITSKPVLDKIVVLRGPNDIYDVEPGMSVFVEVQATTDKLFQSQMKFKWQWYEKHTDKETGVTTIKPVLLPPNSHLKKYIHISQNGRNFTITFPEVNDDDEESKMAYHTMIDRLYTLTIEHQYDRVERNFTINGIDIAPSSGEEAAVNLWLIGLVLAILVLIIVVAVIVCYVYRKRGGASSVSRMQE